MNVSLTLSDDDVERIARAVVALQPSPERQGWMNIGTAADYCDMSPEALRAAEKRGQVRAYRGETGRIRFRVVDLDAFLGLVSQ